MNEKLDYKDMTPKQQRAYNKDLEDRASDRGTLEYARSEAYNKAYKEAYEEVYKEAYKEGKLEAKKKSARNLLKAGSEVDFISKATGLSLEDINNLK